MSTWECFAGDTSRFAIRLAFEPDPDKDVFDDPAYSGSWGSLRIWVTGLEICAHTVAGETDDSVHWYLLPMLEWFAEQWDPLFHEERLPGADRFTTAAEAATAEPALPLGVSAEEYYAALEDWQEWWRRHALESAAEGGLFPRGFFRRWGDQVEVSWRSFGLAGEPEGFHFLAPEGHSYWPAADVAHVIHKVAAAASDELVRRYPTSQRAIALQAAFAAIPASDRAGERLRWLVGIVTERFEDLIGRARSALQGASERTRDALLRPSVGPLVIEGSPHLVALFGSVAPDVVTEDVITLTSVMLEFYAEEHELAFDAESNLLAWDTRAVLVELEAAALPAYEQGNRLADLVLSELEVDEERPVDVRSIIDHLGIRISEIELSDRGIRGISLAGSGHRPACFINNQYHFGRTEQIKRFTLAHELCHLLFDRWRARQLAVASGPWAPVNIERRANAFAAAFLMPRPLLDQAAREVDVPEASLEWLLQIAARAETSAQATLERLANLGLITNFVRDRLRDEVSSRRSSSPQDDGVAHGP